MTLKTHGQSANKDSSWQKRRADAFGKVSDGLVDVANAKKQKISDRLKATGLKEKKVYRAKLGDDLRPFEYTVIKIDRLEGDVWLKSERGTTRKARVFDEIFGPVIRGRKRAGR